MAGHPACISRPDVSPLADAPRSNQSFGGDVEEVGKLGSARFMSGADRAPRASPR